MLPTSAEFDQDAPIGNGRVALLFEYDGAAFHGWQQQKSGVPSVEGQLQQAVSRVANETVDLVCAGRTDAGVHASAQVVHFETRAVRSYRSWIMGVNTALRGDIAVRWAGQMADDFHARFSAISRRYRYVIFNHPVRPGILRNQVAWTFRPLDEERMHQAAQSLVGEHDFSSFRAAGCQSRTPHRNVHFIRVTRHGDYVVIDIQANAFLHHMVRNIAGALMAVGNGKQPVEWIREILEQRDRRQADVTGPAHGLYLVSVGYPEGSGIPGEAPGPEFMQPWFTPEQQALVQGPVFRKQWSASE
ncbi:tRNA pseudouridine(38-40) synthase TruA [Marinobacter sp. R17]|uniref:tRNA pseudouridine(38-40) synthase TruA n=1 Tax=Marinobacter TaxID=2742 RepID=UPI000F4BA801|nr:MULTISPECIES: tRNA pseudouridine(38-40) synthase TruA [Marinobacter]ROT99996.1 tRNA pseudouridine(38-40) synthase TruA [Marinobacter sp. R17]